MKRLESLAGFFILLDGWRRAIFAVLAGALSALALPPFDFFPILFLTFPVFVWLMDGASTDPVGRIFSRFGSSFRLFWCFGFGYFLAGMWWIGNAFLVDAEGFGWLLPFAVIILPAGLALFWAFAGIIARALWNDGASRIFALAFSLGLAEFARGYLFTGLPWNAVGYAAMPLPIAYQSAAVFGLYGITAGAIFVFATPALLGTTKRISTLPTILLGAIIISCHVGYGYMRIAESSGASIENVSLRLMQPNVDQNTKWDPGQDTALLAKYIQLSTRATSPTKQGLSGTTHLIWPESAFPFVLTERRDALSALSAMLPEGTTLITGGVRTEKASTGQARDLVFNSIFMLNSKGEIADATDKVHLVPFGEYLPFQELAEGLGLQQLTKLRGGFSAGNKRKLLKGLVGPSFLPLICYEIIFPGQIRTGEGDPQWIVNLTNDGWFGNTPGPYQHKRQSIIRGVEEGLPVVRVANSGVSFVSDAVGRIQAQIPLGAAGIIDTKLPVAKKTTFYRQFGNFPFFVMLIIFLLISIVGKRRAN